MGTAIAVASDIVVNDSAFGRPGHDPVTAYVIHIVIANHDMQAGKPAATHDAIAVGRDRRTIDRTYNVAFNEQAVETARNSCSPGPEDDAAVVFRSVSGAIGAVHVVHVEAGYDDMTGRAEIVEEDMNTTADRWLRAAIGDLEVSDFDILDVVKADDIFDAPFPVNSRFWSRPESIEYNGVRSRTGTFGRQLAAPRFSGFEEDMVSGLKGLLIDFLQALPCLAG